MCSTLWLESRLVLIDDVADDGGHNKSSRETGSSLHFKLINQVLLKIKQ